MNRITATRTAAELSRQLGLNVTAQKAGDGWELRIQTTTGMLIGEVDLPNDGSIPPVPALKGLGELVQDLIETTYDLLNQ